METMLILWMISGFCFGWVFIDFVGILMKSTIPHTFRVVSALIFTLATFEIYTRVL